MNEAIDAVAQARGMSRAQAKAVLRSNSWALDSSLKGKAASVLPQRDTEEVDAHSAFAEEFAVHLRCGTVCPVWSHSNGVRV